MDLAAALDDFGVDEVLVEVLAAAAPGVPFRRTKRYLALERPDGSTAVYVHRSRLVLSGATHDVLKSSEIQTAADRAAAVALVSAILPSSA